MKKTLAKIFLATLANALVFNALSYAQGTVFRSGFSFVRDAQSMDSPVSGTSGTRVVTENFGGRFGLSGVESSERKDNPCSFVALVENITPAEESKSSIRHRCGSRGPKSSSNKSASFLLLPDTGSSAFVNRITVCRNNTSVFRDTNRIKGIRLRGVRLDESTGTLVPADDQFVQFTRSHCDGRWQNEVACDAGSIAVGLVGHFTGGDAPRSLSGLALQCRPLQFTPGGSNPPQPLSN